MEDLSTPFAFYGTLMAPFWGIEEYGYYGGPCLIPGKLYDLGNFPGLGPGPGTVVGQLFYPTTVGAFKFFDRFEGYTGSRETSMYVRKKVQLVSYEDPTGGIVSPGPKAWVYFWNYGLEGVEEIVSGDWRLENLNA